MLYLPIDAPVADGMVAAVGGGLYVLSQARPVRDPRGDRVTWTAGKRRPARRTGGRRDPGRGSPSLTRRHPRRVADPRILAEAQDVAHEAAGRSPHGDTGQLAAGWTVVPGRVPYVHIVTNTVPYAMFVEYGTRNMQAEPMLGPVLAAHRAAYR